jgi:hypothetical protein
MLCVGGWETKLAMHKDYNKEENGDCNVPRRWAGDPQMASGVSNQRKHKKALGRGEPILMAKKPVRCNVPAGRDERFPKEVHNLFDAAGQPITLEAYLATGDTVIKGPSPLNVSKYTYNRSYYLARSDEHQHLTTDSPMARRTTARVRAAGSCSSTAGPGSRTRPVTR